LPIGQVTDQAGDGGSPSRIGVVGAMAELERRRPGRPKRAGPARETVVALKGTPGWKAWLDGLSGHCRLGLADTIEQSLVYYAQERGFEKPPKR
jgi:hypothetical protein